MRIVVENLNVDFEQRFQLNNINWTIEDQHHWVITGTNGAGKSALAAALAGAGDRLSGQILGLPERIGVVSFEAQEELIDKERKKDDADIMDVISEGTPVRDIIFSDCLDPDTAQQLVTLFGLDYLLARAFRKLSTGESRKVMIIRALSCKPQLLLLDEPFDGLDATTMGMLQNHLERLVERIPIIMVCNRFDEIPDFVTHIAYMQAGELTMQVERQDQDAYDNLYQLLHLKTTDLTIPKAEAETAIAKLPANQPLVKLTDLTIKYDEFKLIDQLNWTIQPNQHWQLSGPNGSGKTAILSIITGDHPQCYTNDILVFGFQRGNGESIWQIKQFIGYVSTALQWEYRVQISLRNVIISGFHDSIGLYTKATDRQKQIADQWLALLGMNDRADAPFQKLSFGDQRLLLIARAMVKHPPLLILDEPCLGLDDMNRQLVLALIEKICASSETSVIYVNHHAEDKIIGIEHFLSLEKNQT
ncbi:MAG: molybdate ABC transporter ATP-binding protein ModF [Gammaproteobacteria bacterium]|jgi:molybdate transport system ATP-binding protein|nr:molybdate ABC transporter ATP-binding protein ModF [Gammaproteobacteria bacterium]MDP6166185.1 molybdate ABC transporter ATP-binding protein ModF [Gammaproteobacteria bacterium]